VTHSISEAVLLADRVVTLTARPARVQAVAEVPFPHPRSLDVQYEPAFTALVRAIQSDLEAGGA
jgi:NitT/TauT family transport system ATP-binding protein